MDPAPLVLLVRYGHRITAAIGYLLFALARFCYTPHSGGPREYGFHWLLTLVANCFLIAGLAFVADMAAYAYRSGGLAQLGRSPRLQGRAGDLGPPSRGEAPSRGAGAVAKLESGQP